MKLTIKSIAKRLDAAGHSQQSLDVLVAAATLWLDVRTALLNALSYDDDDGGCWPIDRGAEAMMEHVQKLGVLEGLIDEYADGLSRENGDEDYSDVAQAVLDELAERHGHLKIVPWDKP